MTHGTVVLVGNLPVEHLALDLLAAEFGWSLKEACSLPDVADLDTDHNLVAVLFSPRDLALSWEQALCAISNAAPKALPILCHGFADGIDWPQAARAGAFHSLLLPFCAREIRQSLGFVFEAKCRQAIIRVRYQSPRRIAAQNDAQQGSARVARVSA